jgi:Uma2 family endonuclease
MYLQCQYKYLACLDWLIELRSHTDRLELLQAKLQEYLAAGLQLGWLIDPIQQQVWIYQPNRAPIQRDRPLELSGDPAMPEFRLDLRAIWPPESTGISPNAP